mmetsp:Transcript_29555/g.43588  ORF Transcript_29555/g.43588 Transcript_29555/m.43588 type:complete len:82 (+) Transcript_29555:4175-4420(+)
MAVFSTSVIVVTFSSSAFSDGEGTLINDCVAPAGAALCASMFSATNVRGNDRYPQFRGGRVSRQRRAHRNKDGVVKRMERE